MNEQYIREMLGNGYLLGINESKKDAILTPGFGRYGSGDIQLDYNIAKEATKRLYKLTEDGEPPFYEREDKPCGYRMGRIEMGMSHELDWYVHIQ